MGFDVGLDDLEPGERRAVEALVAAAHEVRDLNQAMEHHQALRARRRLDALHERLGRPPETADLMRLYDLFEGPIATTLENERLPFLPVDPFAPGRSVYPWAIEAGEIEAFLQDRPDRRPEILGAHTVVRRTSEQALRADLATLRRHPLLDGLHPGLRDRLNALRERPAEAFYTVPYSIAWPERLLAISEHLRRAADAAAIDDPDLAAFLRQRSRDLLTDDNEAGDAAWVRGTFRRLDAVVGAYERYDDDLFGAKTFFGLTIMRRDEPWTAALRAELEHVQEIEDALPIDRPRVVPADIPVGTYDVIATVAQGIQVNAEILPNDESIVRKYGRKILMRRNITMHPGAVDRVMRRWLSAMAPAHHAELTAEGMFRQTTWHEIGHYLGPDEQRSGRPFGEALAEDAPILEELKAELVSAFAAILLHRRGTWTEDDVRGVAATVLLGGLRPARPLRSQPYETLWLMRLNQALETGYLRIETDGLHIEHDRLEESTVSMLRETLGIQDAGSRRDSNAFIERYSAWDERHERIAAAMRSVERHRFMFARFAALGHDVTEDWQDGWGQASAGVGPAGGVGRNRR